MLASVGYADPILEVEFTDGAVYQYTGVTPETFAALLNAPSMGRYFASDIVGHYPTANVQAT